MLITGILYHHALIIRVVQDHEEEKQIVQENRRLREELKALQQREEIKQRSSRDSIAETMQLAVLNSILSKSNGRILIVPLIFFNLCLSFQLLQPPVSPLN